MVGCERPALCPRWCRLFCEVGERRGNGRGGGLLGFCGLSSAALPCSPGPQEGAAVSCHPLVSLRWCPCGLPAASLQVRSLCRAEGRLGWALCVHGVCVWGAGQEQLWVTRTLLPACPAPWLCLSVTPRESRSPGEALVLLMGTAWHSLSLTLTFLWTRKNPDGDPGHLRNCIDPGSF